jgi:hypothetical protein
MIGEPPSLDPHTTTATITREIGINMFETLYTLDAKFQPIPLLAEGHDALDGAKRYVIRLRKGVRFHNGKELTAPTSSPRSSAGGRSPAPGRPSSRRSRRSRRRDRTCWRSV